MKKPAVKKKKRPMGDTVGDLLKNPKNVDGIMEKILFYKDGIDEDGVQLWSRDKGVERVISNALVRDGKFIVRFNKIENCFEYPAGMTSLIGSPRIVNGFVKMRDSPGLISLEGYPPIVKGSREFIGSNNINPTEYAWLFRPYDSNETDSPSHIVPKYTNYWKDYFEYVKERLLDSNLPKEYLEELKELDLVSLATERSEKRRNKAISETSVIKFKL